MRHKRKRKVIKKIPKKKYVQRPKRKESFWSKYSLTIIIFSIVLLMYILLRALSSPRDYDKEIMGNIVSYESKSMISQGRAGSRVSYYYVVRFQYMVDGEHYSNEVFLGYNRTNVPFIRKIEDYGYMYPVKVTYDSHNPQISTIVVE